MKRELDEAKKPNTFPKPLDAYVGKYYNVVGTYHLEIQHRDDMLIMCFQGDHEQWYELEHYNDDVLFLAFDAQRGRAARKISSDQGRLLPAFVQVFEG